MSLITLQSTDALKLLFNNTTWAAVGDATGIVGSTVDGAFYIALFTADPTASGVFTNEADYTGYARVAVNRTTGGFTVSGANVSNTVQVSFGECTAGSNTVTHFAICKSLTGTSSTEMMFRAALDSPLTITSSSNSFPRFDAGVLDVDATTTI